MNLNINGEEEDEDQKEGSSNEEMKSKDLGGEGNASLVNSNRKVDQHGRRLSSSGKKISIIHKPLYKTPSKSFIHIGHENWNLVLHMMLGARQSAMNVRHEEVFDLLDQDFERKYRYELIAKKTKNMKLFEFYDFSPRVFHLIRSMYGISTDAYLKSIGPENLLGSLFMGNIASLKEQCSTGKSGSFFYYTSDSLYKLIS